MSAASEADDYYQKKFQGKGIAPRHVAALKQVLAKALRKNSPITPGAAAKAFFKEKRILVDVAKEPAKPTEKVSAKASKKKPPEAKPEKAKPKIEFADPKDPLDRKLLLATLREVSRASGVKHEASEKATDKQVREQVHGAIQDFVDLDSDYLSKVEGGKQKLFDVLSDGGCLGIGVDLRSATCVVCPEQSDCVKAFFGNLKDGFASVAKAHGLALVGEKAEKSANVIPPEYDPSKMFVVFEVDNPAKAGSKRHAFYAGVLRAGTTTLGDLVSRASIPYPGAAGDVPALLDKLAADGVGCLAENLPKEAIAGLSKAERKMLKLA